MRLLERCPALHADRERQVRIRAAVWRLRVVQPGERFEIGSL